LGAFARCNLIISIRHILKLFAWCSLAFLAWIFLLGFSIVRTGQQDHRYPADLIVVLGAAAYGTQPSPVLKERINHGILLLNDKVAPRILFTGGRALESDLAESEVARDYAMNLGIRADRIIIETTSRTTYENLRETKKVSTELNAKKMILVSDPLHMKRAAIMARDLGMDVRNSATQTSMYKTWRTKFPFLLREIYYYHAYRARKLFRLTEST